MRPRRVWVTRTEPGASATAARLAALGCEAAVRPVLEARPLAGARIELAGVDALAFTSGQGVRAFAALSPRRDLRVFAVGDATAGLARRAGFADVAAAGGDVRALAAALARARPKPACVLVPGAAEPAADLPALLAQAGVPARAVPVYETVEAAVEPPPGIDTVLVHSPRAAWAVAQRLAGRPGTAALEAFAISPAAAAPLAGLGLRRLAAATQPTETALLALLAG